MLKGFLCKRQRKRERERERADLAFISNPPLRPDIYRTNKFDTDRYLYTRCALDNWKTERLFFAYMQTILSAQIAFLQPFNEQERQREIVHKGCTP
jgi:hypothetical protein